METHEKNSKIVTQEHLLELDKLVEKALDDCFGLDDLFRIT